MIKAGTEVATEVGKTTINRIFDGIEKAISTVCKPAGEELGLLFKDKISHWRYSNQLKIFELTQKKLDGKELGQGVKFNYLMPIIEHIPTEDEPILQELWAELLAKSLMGKSQRKLFTSILKQLDPEDAEILLQINSELRKDYERRVSGQANSISEDIDRIQNKTSLLSGPDETEDEIQARIESYKKRLKPIEKRLHFLKKDYDEISLANLARLNLIACLDPEHGNLSHSYIFTGLGKEFIESTTDTSW